MTGLGQSPDSAEEVEWSFDGISWTRFALAHAGGFLRDAAFGNGRFVVGGSNGSLLRSNPIASFRAGEIGVEDAQIHLTFDSVPGTQIHLETSTNLTDWISTETRTNTTGTVQFDALKSPSGYRFYRARVTPSQ